MEDDHIEAREEAPRQIPDRQLVDDRPDQFRKPGRMACVARRSGGQAQSRAREGHLQRLVAEAAAEVMDLVDDQEPEAGAEAVHVAVGAFVRGHRHRRHVATPIAMAADRVGIHRGDLVLPLREKNTRRYQAERRQARRGHGAKGDTRLAAARRKDDDSTPAGQLPGAERSGLVVAEARVGPASRGPAIAVGPIDERNRPVA